MIKIFCILNYGGAHKWDLHRIHTQMSTHKLSQWIVSMPFFDCEIVLKLYKVVLLVYTK